MNWQDTAAIVSAGVMALLFLGGIGATIFKVGAVSGKLDSFMATSERDRTDILKDQGRMEERLNRHIEGHGGK